MTFREFADNAREMASMIVGSIAGGRDMAPTLHLLCNYGESEVASFDASDSNRAEHAVRLIEEFEAAAAVWTFTGRRGTESGFFEHDVLTVVAIDAERAEVWEARLVRHDDGVSHGAWRMWPVDGATGKLIHPLQEALRRR